MPRCCCPSRTGLKTLRDAARGAEGGAALASFLAASPGFRELLQLWDAQASAKGPEVQIQLLALLAELLAPHGGDGKRAAPPADMQAALDALAAHVLQRRLKASSCRVTNLDKCCASLQLQANCCSYHGDVPAVLPSCRTVIVPQSVVRPATARRYSTTAVGRNCAPRPRSGAGRRGSVRLLAVRLAKASQASQVQATRP
jgi:hypothetical protein